MIVDFAGGDLREVSASLRGSAPAALGTELPFDRHPQGHAARGATLQIPGIQGFPGKAFHRLSN